METKTVSKTVTKESIVELLGRSQKAVEKAVLAIYARQTADEQASGQTMKTNGRGFNGVDAEIMSSFACQIERKQGRGVELGQCLSEKQMAIAKKKIVRYAGQLVEVAQEKCQGIGVKAEVQKSPQWVVAQGRITDAEYFHYGLDAVIVYRNNSGIQAAIVVVEKMLAEAKTLKTVIYNGRSAVDAYTVFLDELKAQAYGTEETDGEPVEVMTPEAQKLQAIKNRINAWAKK